MIRDVDCACVVTTHLQCIDHKVPVEVREIRQPVLRIYAGFATEYYAWQKKLVVLLPTTHDLWKFCTHNEIVQELANQKATHRICNVSYMSRRERLIAEIFGQTNLSSATAIHYNQSCRKGVQGAKSPGVQGRTDLINPRVLRSGGLITQGPAIIFSG